MIAVIIVMMRSWAGEIMMTRLGMVLILALGQVGPVCAGEGESNWAQGTSASVEPPQAIAATEVGKDWHDSPPGYASDDDNPSAQINQQAHQDQQSGTFDSWCTINIFDFTQTLRNALFHWFGVSFGYVRKLERYMNGQLAIVDRIPLGITFDYAWSVLANAERSIGLNASATLSGESFVVRPLQDPKDPTKIDNCKAFKRMLDIPDTKQVLPFSEKHLKTMIVGEIWKAPIQFNITAGVGGTQSVIGNLPVSVSLSFTGNSQTNLTIFRKEEHLTRVRIRFDTAVVTSKGAAVTFTIPQLIVNLPSIPDTDNIEGRLALRYVNNLVSNYTQFQAGFGRTDTDGHQILLEYLIDPTDDAQLESLADLLTAHLNMKDKLVDLRDQAWAVTRGTKTEKSERKLAEERKEVFDGTMKKPANFAAIDSYQRTFEGIPLVDSKLVKRVAEAFPWISLNHIHIPIFADQTWSDNINRDNIILIDDVEGEFVIVSRQQAKQLGLLDIPLLQRFFTKRKTVGWSVYSYQNNKANDAPLLQFDRPEGAGHYNKKTAEQEIDHANSIVSLTGTRGHGVNPDTSLPKIAILTKAAVANPDDHSTQENFSLRSSMASLSVAFFRDGVKNVINAPLADVVLATLRVLEHPDAENEAKLLTNAIVTRYGELHYDPELVPEKGRSKESEKVLSMARDLLLLRDLSTQRQVADYLAKMLDQRARADLTDEQFLKVFIQLVDPNNLWGHIMVHADESHPRVNVNVDKQMHEDHPDMKILKAIAQAQSRFAPSLDLKD